LSNVSTPACAVSAISIQPMLQPNQPVQRARIYSFIETYSPATREAKTNWPRAKKD